MDVLVLGGTSFVGRAVVDDLLARGHAPTLFGRGKTGAELFPDVPRLTGDRDTGDYGALTAGRWDAVVDVSGYVPRHVQQAAEAVGDTGRWLFVSTGSVYDHTRAPASGLAEDSPVLPPERGTEQITGTTYGPLKVACEDDVRARWEERATVVRPGIVAGPHDTTDRFTYWVRRTSRGGRVALPARPDQPVQVVDSRDLARLVVRLLEDDRPGTYNASGPAEPVTFRELVEVCARAAGTEVEVVPTREVEGLPLRVPDPSWDPMVRRSAALARSVGMPSTPLEVTARDVLEWDRARGLPELVEGLTEGQEKELLA